MLTAVHHLKHECDRMELPLLITLLQYGTDGIDGCIGVHNEGMFKIGVSEYGGDHYSMDQGVKGLLTGFGSYESSGFGTEGDQGI